MTKDKSTLQNASEINEIKASKKTNTEQNIKRNLNE